MLFKCPFCQENTLVHNNVTNCYSHYDTHIDIIQFYFNRNNIYRMDINFQKDIKIAIFPPEITAVFNFEYKTLKIHNYYKTFNLILSKSDTDLFSMSLVDIKEYLNTLILFS